MNNTKLKTTANPNQKLYLLNGYNIQQNSSNNLFQQPQQQQQQQNKKSQIYPVEKMQKLEVEKLNLQYQVKLLKKQLNNDVLNMIQQQQQQTQYNNNNNNDINNNYAKVILMAMNNNNTTKVNDIMFTYFLERRSFVLF
jgi:hypothetical protein